MKLTLVCVAVALVSGLCQADKLQDTVNKIRDEYSTKFSNMRTDLKTLGGDLKDLAVHKVKSLGGQTIQALIGAFSNAFKGFNLSEILFGKRELSTLDDLVWKLILNATERLEDQFDRTFEKFDAAIQSLRHLSLGSIEKFHPERLEVVAANHHRVVRGIIGDTLNKAIDGLKSLWYKAKGKIGQIKDSLLGGSSDSEVISDPVMVGRRGLLSDAWQKLSEKFDKIKQTAYNHARGASEVVNHVSKALGHYAGQMVEHAKNQALDKAHETFGALKEHLTGYLSGAKDSLESFKQQVSEKLQNIINGEE